MEEMTMNNYEMPTIRLSEAATKNLGKYGRMRKQYLQEHRPGLYNDLLLSGTLHTPAGNRPDRPQTLGTDDAGDGKSSRSNKGIESPCSFALGGADEHLQGSSGGNYSERTDI